MSRKFTKFSLSDLIDEMKVISTELTAAANEIDQQNTALEALIAEMESRKAFEGVSLRTD